MYLVIQYGPKLMYITETKIQAEKIVENHNNDLIKLILLENPSINKDDNFMINQIIRDSYDELYVSEINIANIKEGQDYKTSEGEIVKYNTLVIFLHNNSNVGI